MRFSENSNYRLFRLRETEFQSTTIKSQARGEQNFAVPTPVLSLDIETRCQKAYSVAMRGHFLVVALAMLISSSNAVAAPSPKAGTSCPKAGAIKTYKGKEFTCIKSGKTLVWK
ncbi:MAG: hypothetical protein LW628_15005, partial [Fimbriimonadaceae bacterium]|nr:hypothetical protein [Fimbriimonadaceae bacterium]